MKKDQDQTLTPDRKERHAPYLLLLIFLCLASGIVSGGWFYFRNFENNFLDQVFKQLSAVARLKVNTLSQWRRERFDDANLLYKNPSLAALSRRYVENHGDEEAAREIQEWLEQYLGFADSDQIRLLDTRGVALLSSPEEPPPLSSSVFQHLPEVVRDRRVSLLDFYRNEHNQRPFLSMLIPIANDSRPDQVIAVFAVRLAPGRYLYPMIQQWPIVSRTAETLLVRRQGDEVVFLNELRFKKDSALNLRLPITDLRLPATQAVLGHEIEMEGIDYRGVPVFASVRRVPDSPWALVAKIDATEVRAPLRERLRLVLCFIVLLLLGAAMAMGLIWRQQSLRHYRRQVQTMEELQRKNAEIERFAYTVSHDLKSPVVTVTTFLGFLEQDIARQDEASVKQDIGYIRTAADKMGRLLNELLEMSRIGRVVNPPEQVMFQELVQEVLRVLAGPISERGVEIRVADTVLALYGDRPRLLEIWQNLVENAVKYLGDQAAPRIEIGVEGQDGNPVFFVRDNGIGIDPRYHAKVFGLFEKLDPKSAGTGLGLTLVKRIIELYNGKIWLESAGPGAGVCFRFTLPGAIMAGGRG